MGFLDCIDEAVKSKKLSEKRAEYVRGLSETLADIYRKQGDLSEAELQLKAQQTAVETTIAAAREKAIGEAKQILLQRDVYDTMKTHKKGAQVGLLSTLHTSFKGQSSGIHHGVSVELGAQVNEERYLSQMPLFRNTFKAGWTGQYGNPAGQELLARALHGEKIENPKLRAVSDEARNVLDQIHSNARKAGIAVEYLKNYLPHYWNPLLVAKLDKDPALGAQKFTDTVFPRLKRSAFTDVNGNPMSDEEIKSLLKNEIYPNIITQGDYKASEAIAKQVGHIPSTKKAPLKPVTEEAAIRQFKERVFGKPKGRLTGHRVLEFNSANDWLELNKQFGGMSPVQSIYRYIHGATMETALANKFGRDYVNSFSQLRSLANTITPRRLLQRDPQTIFDYLAGRGLNEYDLNAMQIDKTASDVRAIVSAAALAKTPITAITDINQMYKETRVLNASFGKALSFHFNLLAGNPELGQIAHDLGISNTLMLGAVGNRFNELSAHGFTGFPSKIENLAVRATGLHKWTIVEQTGMGLAINSKIALDATKNFGELSPVEQQTYEMFGLNKENWDDLKSAVVQSKTKGTFIDPSKLPASALKEDPMLDQKVGALVLFGRNRGIPHNDAMINTFLQANRFKGNIVGEIALRNPLQFKHFFIGSIYHYVDELLYAPINAGLRGKAAMVVSYSLVGLFLGAISKQLKNLVSGKDVTDMSKPMFWIGAAAEGLGGMGYLPEVIEGGSEEDWNQLGLGTGGASGLIAAGLGKILSDVTIRPLNSLINDKPYTANPFKDLLKFSQSVVPQTWYTQALYRHLIYDQLMNVVDSNVWKANRRLERKADEEGSGYWYEPGEAFPSRLPGYGG